MKAVPILIAALLVLSACQGATIREEWPDRPDTPEQPVQSGQEPVEEPAVEAERFSLVQREPRLVELGNRTFNVTLLGMDDNRSRLRVGDVSFRLGLNETIERHGYQWTVEEFASVPVPRKSWVDLSVAGERRNIRVNDSYAFVNSTVSVDFVGLREGVPTARVSIGGESEFLTENDEHYYDAAFVYVHDVYYNGPDEYDEVPAVTVRVGNY